MMRVVAHTMGDGLNTTWGTINARNGVFNFGHHDHAIAYMWIKKAPLALAGSNIDYWVWKDR